MKEYKDVKRAVEAALKGILRTMDSSLDYEDYKNLCIEISMTLFTASMDFSLPYKKFIEELVNRQIKYTFELAEQITDAKVAFDKGELDEANQI